ncbi:DUF5992 family protein [Microbulbifer sp. VVAC002]|uniref:DUF5992 family protein n=1 Tax=Microbulbifer sp. VVAC002 TaxID=3243387 RepID=UPI00403A526E
MWDSPDTQSCTSDDVYFSETSLGNAEAVERAFSIALTATVSGKPIRFYLDGCEGSLQKATAVQLCATDDCSY